MGSRELTATDRDGPNRSLDHTAASGSLHTDQTQSATEASRGEPPNSARCEAAAIEDGGRSFWSGTLEAKLSHLDDLRLRLTKAGLDAAARRSTDRHRLMLS